MFTQQVVNGILSGSMYALLAISYTLILGVLNMLNLAQGEILTCGALVAYSVLSAGKSLFTALILSISVCVVLSLIVYVFCFKLPKGDTQVVTTIAMGMILQNVYTGLWGSESLKFSSGKTKIFNIGSITLNNTQIVLLIITVVLMISLSIIIEKSQFGRQMRALSDNKIAAKVSGTNITQTTIKTFILSGVIAGISGVMSGLVFTSITAFIGGTIGDKAMVAMVIGGTGSALGAGISGIILGIIEVFSVGYLGGQYREIVVFPLLMIFLWLRPSGIFKKGKVERA